MAERLQETETEGDGHQEETQEQLKTALLDLDKMHRGDGSVVTMTKQELGLLQTILRTASDEFREYTFWRMLNFIDEDEAFDHVAAFNESKLLGMDTGLNIMYANALCSANRKTAGTNLIGLLTDTLQNAKWVTGAKGKKQDGYQNPRSPLSVS